MATESTANQPSANTTTPAQPSIKVATPDLFVFKDEVLPIEVMTDLIFEDIGGHELITISRNDMLSGQNVSYQPIKNVTSLYTQYNPQNILNLQDTSETYFRNFPIKLERSIPEDGTGTGPNGSTVYIDSNGDLVINVINLETDEQVDVQVLVDGTILNGTIYEGNN